LSSFLLLQALPVDLRGLVLVHFLSFGGRGRPCSASIPEGALVQNVLLLERSQALLVRASGIVPKIVLCTEKRGNKQKKQSDSHEHLVLIHRTCAYHASKLMKVVAASHSGHRRHGLYKKKQQQ
jgi:hypothetical protein